MGWKETCAMEERFKFIEDYKSQDFNVSELCRRYGVSRQTGYKWIERYEQEGVDGLKDQSRAPNNHPNQISPEVELAIIDARQRHPTWGPMKLHEWLQRRDRRVA